MPRRSTTEEFIKKSRKVHKDKYDYSLVEYKGSDIEVKIICPIHGEVLQTPHHHLGGHLPKCCGNMIIDSKKRKWDQKSIIQKFRQVHENKFDYSKVQFKTVNDPVTIICPIHGEFLQKPNDHKRGSGCDGCAKDSRKGAGNPNYKDGRALHRANEVGRLRTTQEGNAWKKAVKSNVNNCDCCGEQFKEGQTKYAHHLYSFIDNEELRYDVMNGVCLCFDCHHNFHKKYGVGNNTKEQYLEFKDNKVYKNG